MAIEVSEVSVVVPQDGKDHPVLEHISFVVESGEFLAVLGPSGCGKSTLLRILAGFSQPSSGSVKMDGVNVSKPDSDRTMMMQQNSLFPWIKIRENVEYPLMIKGVSPEERLKVAIKWLREVGLAEFVNYYPAELSIGMQQRAALARLFTGNAAMLLMDEPFAALDTVNRAHCQKLLLQIWQRERRTIVFVTHDVEEALLLADRALVLGGTPTRILHVFPIAWQRPRDLDVIFTEDFVRTRRQVLELFGA